MKKAIAFCSMDLHYSDSSMLLLRCAFVFCLERSLQQLFCFSFAPSLFLSNKDLFIKDFAVYKFQSICLSSVSVGGALNGCVLRNYPDVWAFSLYL